jgi:tetratricopeptide (TPR) repeat protein
MKREMRWFAVFFCVAVTAGAGVSGQETAAVAIRQGTIARDKGDIDSLRELVRNAGDLATKVNSFDANLRLALLSAFLVEAAHDHHDDKIVKQASQDGVAAAERAVKLNVESSEAHRLVGTLLGELIPHVMAGGMRYGPRSTQEIEKAMQLDPRNANAYVARGNAYFFTPKAFGGDKDKAIDTWNKAIAIAPGSDAAQTAHILLARAYKSLGKPDDATKQIDEALKINPDREFAKLVHGQLAAK